MENYEDKFVNHQDEGADDYDKAKDEFLKSLHPNILDMITHADKHSVVVQLRK